MPRRCTSQQRTRRPAALCNIGKGFSLSGRPLNLNQGPPAEADRKAQGSRVATLVFVHVATLGLGHLAAAHSLDGRDAPATSSKIGELETCCFVPALGLRYARLGPQRRYVRMLAK